MKFTDLETAKQRMSFALFRTRFNQFFQFLEKWHRKNPGFKFEPTKNMLAMYVGFASSRMMMEFLESEPVDRVNKPISNDEIMTTLAVFHEIRASSAAQSAGWLSRHFPYEWAKAPDMTKGGAALSVNMDEQGGIQLTVVRDYVGRSEEK